MSHWQCFYVPDLAKKFPLLWNNKVILNLILILICWCLTYWNPSGHNIPLGPIWITLKMRVSNSGESNLIFVESYWQVGTETLHVGGGRLAWTRISSCWSQKQKMSTCTNMWGWTSSAISLQFLKRFTKLLWGHDIMACLQASFLLAEFSTWHILVSNADLVIWPISPVKRSKH